MYQQRVAFLLPAVCLQLLIASGALATPIVLDQTNAAASYRRDRGTGLSGHFVHYKTQATPLGTINDAVSLLNLPLPDPAILNSTGGPPFGVMNFRNTDPGAGGDFTSPNFAEALFPYSQDIQAMPSGDNNNIAMRLRGYLNIAVLPSQPMTFALNCNDACSLRIGGRDIILADASTAARVTQQVLFKATGLYPVEIVYYQNTNEAYFEWLRALSAEPEGSQTSPLDTTRFKPVPLSDLFATLVGSPFYSIEECGAPGQSCLSMLYCGDGLCQGCIVADHCGPTCAACPAGQRICDSGRCVQCSGDANCIAGWHCLGGSCMPGTPCTSDANCAAPQICRETGYCDYRPVVFCQLDSECMPGQVCSCPAGMTVCPQKLCAFLPGNCAINSDCSTGQYCDTASHSCRLPPADGGSAGVDDGTAGGGMSGGCNSAGSSSSAVGAGFLCFALALLLARRRTRLAP